MTGKLSWEYDQTHGCKIAFHNGYMIKAEYDNNPENPLEAWEGAWPVHVYAGRDGLWSYPKDANLLGGPFGVLNDAQLVHDQHAIAAALDTSIGEVTADTEGGPVRYCRDAEHLREMFCEYMDALPDSKQLEAAATLWRLAGVPALVTTSTGYSQGDWAELLVVATPEKQSSTGITSETMRAQAIKQLSVGDVRTDATENVVAAQVEALWQQSLKSTADLYGDWAWGNVYGYTIWKPVFDEDGEIEDWDQLDDSCWGFYGSDHAESGLEEQALDAVPEEPVRLPDNASSIEGD